MDFEFGDKTETIVSLKEALSAIKADVFEGVIVISKGHNTSSFVNNGDVDDRVRVVDAMYATMYKMRETGEPNITAFTIFMEEMYKRNKFYFGTREMTDLLVWCKQVTEVFQRQKSRRWTYEDVRDHHIEEINEFEAEVACNDKEKMVLEFWDSIFSILTVMAIDDYNHITIDEWMDGFRKTVEKINHRAATNHYGKKEENEYP